jgi:glutathionyl-hydroquinone reductase
MVQDSTSDYVTPGKEFRRDMRYLSDRITTDGRDGWPVEPGRYRLVGAAACPWAHRSVIVRGLLGLQEVISLGMTGPTHDPRSWTFDLDPGGRDPVLGIERLQESYFNRIPDYPRGITVPAIIDVPSGKVVTNDFPWITHDFFFEWSDHHRPDAPNLWPADCREEMGDVMQRVFTDVNNGVYRCGFAGTTRHSRRCSPPWTGWRSG